MQEQEEREFWEWCGFKRVTVRARAFEVVRGKKHSWETCEQRWLRPNCVFEEKLYPSYHGVPFVDWVLPALDLNSLFRYAVPKVALVTTTAGLLNLLNKWAFAIYKLDKDPAQALYQAIQEVRKSCSH